MGVKERKKTKAHFLAPFPVPLFPIASLNDERKGGKTGAVLHTSSPRAREPLDTLVGDFHVFLLNGLGGALRVSLSVAVSAPSKVPADTGFLQAWLMVRSPGFIAGVWD